MTSRQPVLERTRRSLHGLAELVLAGPQYRTSGTIRLRVVPGGFATVASPALGVAGVDLVVADARHPLDGRSYADLAALAGVAVGAPEGLYSDGSGAEPSNVVEVDPASAGHLTSCLALGDAALRRFAPGETPVLWPEHFDLAVSVAEVNYGVSLGDRYLAEPYAYVGPWRLREGSFWNAPFGAARPMRELSGVDALLGFFTDGASATSRG
ncbi:MAG TPA: hypothetical protein VFB84_03425 [Micromonosporaceae bacterium]|nr:hypothetical protein [Micromonosporaceae bacterium]